MTLCRTYVLSAVLWVIVLWALLVAEPVNPVDIEPRWDIDGDGVIDINDAHLLQMYIWLGDDGYFDLELDFHPDGVIDYEDLVTWRMHFGPLDDFNFDGKFDAADAAIFDANYLQPQPPWRWYGDGDITCDGVVNSSDIVLIMQHEER